MTRLTEIYNRLDLISDLIELQKPHFSHDQVISDQITALLGYVEHVTIVIWEQQWRNRLTDFDIIYILPVLDDIYISMKELKKDEKNGEQLSDLITDFIGLVCCWMLHIENQNAGKVNP